MPRILYSVEVEGMQVEDLTLDRLHAIQRLGATAMGGDVIRITAVTKRLLFHYIVENWDDRGYAAHAVYGDEDRRPLNAWDLAR